MAVAKRGKRKGGTLPCLPAASRRIDKRPLGEERPNVDKESEHTRQVRDWLPRLQTGVPIYVDIIVR